MRVDIWIMKKKTTNLDPKYVALLKKAYEKYSKLEVVNSINEAENKINEKSEKNDKETPKDENKKPEDATNPAETPKAPEPVKEEDDDEFKEYFEIFSNPELSKKDEVTYIKKLISDKKSALVRKLVVRLATVAGAGKSNIFKSLAKKFVGDAAKPVQNGVTKTEAKPEVKSEVKPEVKTEDKPAAAKKEESSSDDSDFLTTRP